MTRPIVNEDGVDREMTDEEIAALEEAQAAPSVTLVPDRATKLGLKRAFAEQGMWDAVKAWLAANPEAQEEWDLCTELYRGDPLVVAAIEHFELTAEMVDALLVRADELTRPG